MRSRVLFIGVCGLLLAACSLDWDTLTAGGDPFDAAAADDGLALPDAHVRDSSPVNDPDTSQPDDAGDMDGGDATPPDSSADAVVPDASIPDTSVPDTSVPDSSVVDSGSVCSFTFSGTLATYDFSAEPGNQASTAVKSSTAGLTAGAVSRSGALVAQSGAGSINSSNWGTGSSIDGTKYYTLTLTPPAKCVLGLTSVSIDTKASGTGPPNGAMATSDDGFASSTAFATSSVTSVSLSVSGSSSAVEIRIYGFKASGSAGTLRIENTMTVSGSLK